VRVESGIIRNLKPGVRLFLNEEHEVGIKDVREYLTFSGMLEHHEEAETIMPKMSKDEILRVLKSLYSLFKERLGVFAIELESLKK